MVAAFSQQLQNHVRIIAGDQFRAHCDGPIHSFGILDRSAHPGADTLLTQHLKIFLVIVKDAAAVRIAVGIIGSVAVMTFGEEHMVLVLVAVFFLDVLMDVTAEGVGLTVQDLTAGDVDHGLILAVDVTAAVGTGDRSCCVTATDNGIAGDIQLATGHIDVTAVGACLAAVSQTIFPNPAGNVDHTVVQEDVTAEDGTVIFTRIYQDAALIANWNSVVTDADAVSHAIEETEKILLKKVKM